MGDVRTAFWKRDRWPLGALLGVDLLLGLAVAWKVPFQAPNPAYLCDAWQLAATHRVASVFLPVGYSGVLGVSEWLGGQAGMTALSIVLTLAVIAAAWAFVRTLGMTRHAAFGLTALLSVYPDLLLSYNKAQDTAITAVVLFVFVTLLLRALKWQRFSGVEVLLGLTLGVAVLVRPNLALLVPAMWVVYWRFGVAGASRRVVYQFAIAAGCYLAGTTAVHGRPFLPHNGPYNLYSGANEFTQAHMANEEDSLPAAMALHGITVANPNDGCSQESGDPARPDIHERRLDPLYLRFALQFMRAHPFAMLGLTGRKLVTLLSPDFWVHAPGSVGGAFKILAALAFPLWLLTVVVWPHPQPRDGPLAAGFVVVMVVACYILPFVLTVSSPRFRVPLDFLLWMDLGAMVVWRLKRGWRRRLGQREPARAGYSVYSDEET